jgi:hypothetical protein
VPDFTIRTVTAAFIGSILYGLLGWAIHLVVDRIGR